MPIETLYRVTARLIIYGVPAWQQQWIARDLAAARELRATLSGHNCYALAWLGISLEPAT